MWAFIGSSLVLYKIPARLSCWFQHVTMQQSKTSKTIWEGSQLTKWVPILHLVYPLTVHWIYIQVFHGSQTHDLVFDSTSWTLQVLCNCIVCDVFVRKCVLPIKWLPVDAPLRSWRLWKCNDSWKGRCWHRTGSRGRVPPVSPDNRPSAAVLE